MKMLLNAFRALSGGTDMTLTIALLEAGRRLAREPGAWRQRSQIRARLAALPQRQLQDMGLDPDVVAREVQRPFWRPLGTMLGCSGDAVRRAEAALTSVPALRHVPQALRPAATFSAVLLPWRS
jgi:uncharacterized protein YjiS (DUF1127 family)